MTEQEKREKVKNVINAFERVVEVFDGRISGPYFEAWICATKDALTLLKAQEPKPPVVKENSYGWKFYYCPSCGKEFYQNNKFSFCENCGTEVKWE